MKKVALITGASSGIGLELAKLHAYKGGDLVIVAKTTEDLTHVAELIDSKCQSKVYCITKDLSKPGAATELYNEIKSQEIEINYLINNAELGNQGYFYEQDLETNLAMMQINMIAVTELTRKFLPDFIARGFGKILNTSSTAALMPGPLQAVYYATKAYVTSFSNAIASELEGTGVTVTALMPEATETRLAQRSRTEKTESFKQTASASKIAQEGYEAMMQGKLDIIAGIPFPLSIMLKTSPFFSKKKLLNHIKKSQQVEQLDTAPIQ
ncbi:SDR family NAD(P)-dependent oxidoreductase [Candidatus Epulonipiscium viviparus]|uniref:SDR family NAD(P)-dependent oxidoreductase n=1 Tax=Candidatus Epulonipiscium viviparus TaxID=420336 RepID=UPI00273803DE|nr:SDR family NAD(P)-dependent oxidoreductase [Candidatus Epulopiscium viviparus]